MPRRALLDTGFVVALVNAADPTTQPACGSGGREILTLDRRGFESYRLRGRERFVLLR